MNQIQVATGIIEAEARDAIKSAKTVEDKLRAAFSVARNHWMFTDKETQITAGIAAVLLNIEKGGNDYRRIERELNFFKALSAASSGVPVNLESLTTDDKNLEPVHIRKLWNEYPA